MPSAKETKFDKTLFFVLQYLQFPAGALFINNFYKNLSSYTVGNEAHMVPIRFLASYMFLQRIYQIPIRFLYAKKPFSMNSYTDDVINICTIDHFCDFFKSYGQNLNSYMCCYRNSYIYCSYIFLYPYIIVQEPYRNLISHRVFK